MKKNDRKLYRGYQPAPYEGEEPEPSPPNQLSAVSRNPRRASFGSEQIWIEDQFYGWVTQGWGFYWPVYEDGTTLKKQKTRDGAIRAMVNHNLMR